MVRGIFNDQFITQSLLSLGERNYKIGQIGEVIGKSRVSVFDSRGRACPPVCLSVCLHWSKKVTRPPRPHRQPLHVPGQKYAIRPLYRVPLADLLTNTTMTVRTGTFQTGVKLQWLAMGSPRRGPVELWVWAETDRQCVRRSAWCQWAVSDARDGPSHVNWWIIDDRPSEQQLAALIVCWQIITRNLQQSLSAATHSALFYAQLSQLLMLLSMHCVELQ